MGKHNHTHLHLIWLSCSQNHLVPVFWDTAYVSIIAQGTVVRRKVIKFAVLWFNLKPFSWLFHPTVGSLSDCVCSAMRQMQWKHYRAAAGNPAPGTHSGGAEGGVRGRGGGERPHRGAIQPEDDSRVCGLQPCRRQQRHFCHGRFWWVSDHLIIISCLSRCDHKCTSQFAVVQLYGAQTKSNVWEIVLSWSADPFVIVF